MSMEPKNPARRKLLGTAGSLALAAGMGISASPLYAKNKQAVALPKGSFYRDVDDIRMYCEVYGSGPLMILQTGMWLSSIGESNHAYRVFMAALSEYFTVLTFDSRGQGKTTLGNGPISYGRYAADTVRLMDVLDIASAHFIGHSDGGCIQLDLLSHFSDRVKTATLCGTAYNHSAYSESLQAGFNIWFQEMVDKKNYFSDLQGKPVTQEALEISQKNYGRYSPNPEKFLDVKRQNRRCWATEPDFSLKQLAAIERPVLVVNSGDDPFIPTQSMKQLAATIPGAKRFDLPGMTHDISPYAKEIAAATSEFIQAGA